MLFKRLLVLLADEVIHLIGAGRFLDCLRRRSYVLGELTEVFSRFTGGVALFVAAAQRPSLPFPVP